MPAMCSRTHRRADHVTDPGHLAGNTRLIAERAVGRRQGERKAAQINEQAAFRPGLRESP